MNTGENMAGLQSQMRTLLAYLETPVLITGTNYKAAYINPAFEKAFLVTFREALGKDIAAFMPPSSAEVLVEAGEDAKDKGKPLRLVLHKEGQYFSVGASPVENEDGRVSGVVYSFTDISKERQLEQVRADFISLLLNDLRVPLIEISNSFSELKTEIEEDADIMAIVEGGIANTEEVLGHLEQLLHVTDSISDDLKLSMTEIDPGMLLDTALKSLTNMAQKSEVHVEQFAMKKIPMWNCDRDKILQVLIFMVTEQIKAAGQGGTVTVGLNAASEGDRPEKLFISAAQPVKTIDREVLPELFEDSYAKNITDPTRLAAKKIVEAHGGTFSLVGVEGHGCAFTVTFPL